MTFLPVADSLHLLLAQTASDKGPPAWTMFIYFGLFAAVMYFVLIRPQQVMKKKQDELIGSAKSGDRVTTSGGIVGTVTNVRENTFLVRVAPNVKLEILKSAIAGVDKGDDKAAAEPEEDDAPDDEPEEETAEVGATKQAVPRNRSKKKRR